MRTSRSIAHQIKGGVTPRCTTRWRMRNWPRWPHSMVMTRRGWTSGRALHTAATLRMSEAVAALRSGPGAHARLPRGRQNVTRRREANGGGGARHLPGQRGHPHDAGRRWGGAARSGGVPPAGRAALPTGFAGRGGHRAAGLAWFRCGGIDAGAFETGGGGEREGEAGRRAGTRVTRQPTPRQRR